MGQSYLSESKMYLSLTIERTEVSSSLLLAFKLFPIFKFSDLSLQLNAFVADLGGPRSYPERHIYHAFSNKCRLRSCKVPIICSSPFFSSSHHW